MISWLMRHSFIISSKHIFVCVFQNSVVVNWILWLLRENENFQVNENRLWSSLGVFHNVLLYLKNESSQNLKIYSNIWIFAPKMVKIAPVNVKIRLLCCAILSWLIHCVQRVFNILFATLFRVKCNFFVGNEIPSAQRMKILPTIYES